jgi:hypothetical protein
MTAPTQTPVTVTQEDEDLAVKLWRVHPDEIVAQGMTRPQWYAREIARHRIQAEAASQQREARLREALGRIGAALDEYFRNTALSYATDDCIDAIVSAMLHPDTRAALAHRSHEGGE